MFNLRTGELQIVPGLEFPPKTGVGLAFSPDDRWLALALNEGRYTKMLVWRIGTDRLARVPGKLPGRVSWAPPVLVTGD